MFIPKINQNQYINTFNKVIDKKFRTHFQDPTRDLLDPMVEFVKVYKFKPILWDKFTHSQI